MAVFAAQAHAQAADPAPVPPSDPAPSASGQTTAPASNQAANGPASADGAMPDIIVTALKERSSLQRTPVVVDVVQSESLTRTGVANIAAIENIAPALNFGTTNGLYTTVTIRGVSSQDGTELGDPAVAFNVDGEYISRPLNLAATLFDVDRIEILRGPQGTLYGRNATAGAVNIITKAPVDKFEAGITASVGNYALRAAQGYINVPLADSLAVRLSGTINERDGTTRYENGLRGEEQDIKAARLRILFKPTSRLTFDITGEYVDTGGTGPATKGILLNGAQPDGTLPTDLSVPMGDRNSFSAGLKPYVDTKQRAVRGTVTYDLGAVKLTDTIAYRTTELRSLFNFQGTPIWVLDYSNDPSKYRTFNNELRLSGRIGGVSWQAGYYHFHEKQEVLAKIYENVSPYLAPRDSLPNLIFNYRSVTSQSDAVFGEVTVPITDRLSLTGGARYSHDRKERDGDIVALDIDALNASAGAVRNYITSSADGKSSSSRVNYNIVLNYQATPTNLFYAKYTTGYKSGGFDTVGQYGPEDLKSFEIGTKNRFFGGKLQVNADAFFYNYTNQQIATLLTLPSGIVASATQNAASDKPKGVELDVIAQITHDDRLRFTADYIHARFETFNAVATAFGGANISADLKGKRPPFTPDLTLSADFSHTFRLPSADLIADVMTAYKTKYYTEPTNYLGSEQSGFTKTDFTLTYRRPGNGWEITAFVRNIENKRTLKFGAFTFDAGQSLYRYQFSEPRTYGVTGSAHF